MPAVDVGGRDVFAVATGAGQGHQHVGVDEVVGLAGGQRRRRVVDGGDL